MIEETGQIVSCDGDYAWVETERSSACSNCSANKGCGTGALSKVYANRFSRVKALNQIDAAPGAAVVLGLQEDALVRGSLAVYGLPLLGLLLMAILGDVLANKMGFEEADGVITIFGIVGLLLGFYLVRLFSRKISHDERYQPIVLRYCDQAFEETVVVKGTSINS